VTKKFIFLLPKQKYFALALQVKLKVQGVYDFTQINCKQTIKLTHSKLLIIILFILSVATLSLGGALNFREVNCGQRYS
jgi:hypothetical protein